jgi:hypothetical protein
VWEGASHRTVNGGCVFICMSNLDQRDRGIMCGN